MTPQEANWFGFRLNRIGCWNCAATFGLEGGEVLRGVVTPAAFGGPDRFIPAAQMRAFHRATTDAERLQRSEPLDRLVGIRWARPGL